jgi:hypothetical protein
MQMTPMINCVQGFASTEGAADVEFVVVFTFAPDYRERNVVDLGEVIGNGTQKAPCSPGERTTRR